MNQYIFYDMGTWSAGSFLGQTLRIPSGHSMDIKNIVKKEIPFP